MLEELLWRQIARLPPIEDRLGDIRREIAETDEAREVGPADTFALDAAKAMPSPWVSAALNRRALRSSFTNRAFGFAVANGSVPSITILISRPVREVALDRQRLAVGVLCLAQPSGFPKEASPPKQSLALSIGATLIASITVRTRLAAGGNRIRRCTGPTDFPRRYRHGCAAPGGRSEW